MEIEEFDHGIQYNAGIFWETPLDGLRLGVSGWYMYDICSDVRFNQDFGPDISAGTVTPLEVDRWDLTYSIEYVWENLRLVAEYRRQHTENKWAELNFPESEVDAEGYYAGASYRFIDWLELGTFYSEYYPDRDDKDGDSRALWGQDDFLAWQKDLAFIIRFDINEYWLVKIEGHSMDGVADMALMGDNPDGLEQRDFLFIAKATYNF
jgi:hypothetical protein